MEDKASKVGSKVSYSYIRRVAAELVENSLASAGYKAQTVKFVSESLGEVISSEAELDTTRSKTIQNQLLTLLDSEPDASIEEEVL